MQKQTKRELLKTVGSVAASAAALPILPSSAAALTTLADTHAARQRKREMAELMC